ncbi:MAG: Rieske (2Fe-2S) protein [Anaerolineae bacterium]|nr:Rieske (2Fe-2S) protein [Anaerolineae bacterium]
MGWVRILDEENLPRNERQIVKIGRREILVIRQEDQIFACDNHCPHLHFPITLGRLDADGTLHCPWHQSAFDLHTGDVKAWAPWPPGGISRILGKLSREETLPVFAVKLEDGGVWLELRD